MMKKSLLLFTMLSVVGCSNISTKSSEHNYSINEDNYRKVVKDLFYEHKANFDKKYGYRELKLEIRTDPKQKSSARAFNTKDTLLITENLNKLINSYYLYFSNEELNDLRKHANSKYDHEMLDKVIQESNDFEFFNEEEKYLLVEQVIVHELGHLYFVKRNQPSYPPEINLIKNDRFEVWKVRDELYADLVSLLILKEKYQDSDLFRNFVKKLGKSRLNEGADYALLHNGTHLFYALYRNPSVIYQIDSHDVNKITKKVDEMTLDTLKMFGTGLEEKKDFDVNKLSDYIMKEVAVISGSCLYYSKNNVDNCFNYNAVNREMHDKLDHTDHYDQEVKQVLEQFFKMIKH
ncbi:hypothetical protein [uncultured Actinobacillus sp.]|uniref:hypothetical protein n=1 Tax=uncultured Actinobacillus sp. TaxID=417616 RepID=UPI0025CBBDC6|nr:hypothetical protein [uncultured Actinobacillus sp.]